MYRTKRFYVADTKVELIGAGNYCSSVVAVNCKLSRLTRTKRSIETWMLTANNIEILRELLAESPQVSCNITLKGFMMLEN